MNKPHQRPIAGPKAGDDRGVALMLTLGVLAMLLLLAMAFAYTANTDRMAASVNADITKARMLCDSGLERAMAYLSFSHLDSTNTANLFPGTKPSGLFVTGSGDWLGHYYAASTAATVDATDIDKAMTVDLGFDYTPTSSLPANVTWHHIWDKKATAPTTDDDLIGRVAFLIIDESGKLDPTASTSAVAEGSETRIGRLPDEINVVPALDGIAANELQNMMHSEASTWFSWRQMRARITMTDTQATNASKSILPCSYDIEAFDHDEPFVDANSNGVRDATEIFTDENGNATWDQTWHRFDLGRTAAYWDALTSASISALVSDHTGGNVQAFYNKITTPWTIAGGTTGSIPWLTKMVDSGGASVSNQVAANLIDYSDSNSIATTDYALGAATYVGLEPVPYINEIAFTVTRRDDGTTNETVDIQIDVELINIYGYDSTAGRLYVKIDLAKSLPDATDTTTSIVSDLADLDYIDFSGIVVPKNSYKTVSATKTYQGIAVEPAATPIEITGVTILLLATNPTNTTPSDAVVTANLWDFAKISKTLSRDLATTDQNTPFYGGFYVTADPRVNTDSSDWAAEAFSDTDGTTIATNLAVPPWTNGMNKGLGADPSNGDDAETATDPAGCNADGPISTAYIRNGPMRSLWELGAIHRGESWRTLNLRGYADTSSADYGKYSQGDGAILDEVKLTSDTEPIGKVNINTPRDRVLDSLLTGITVGGTYLAPGGGSAVSAVASLRSAIKAASGAGPLNARGLIADITNLTDGTCGEVQDTDAKQEEIIGKIANLLTIRENFYRVIVTAQAVKDLGALPVALPGAIQYDGTKYCTVLAEQKIMALVYRDAYRNTFAVISYQYLED